MSQLLYSDFVIDTIKVVPKQVTLVEGMDYMTTFQDWLDVQVCVLPAHERAVSHNRMRLLIYISRALRRKM